MNVRLRSTVRPRCSSTPTPSSCAGTAPFGNTPGPGGRAPLGLERICAPAGIASNTRAALKTNLCPFTFINGLTSCHYLPGLHLLELPGQPAPNPSEQAVPRPGPEAPAPQVSAPYSASDKTTFPAQPPA